MTPLSLSLSLSLLLSDASLEASLSFLDLFAPRRGGIYSSMLQELNDALTERIHKGMVDKDK